MDILGSHRIPAPRASVWAALHDPETVKSCMPGCETLERISDDGYEGVIEAKVGPIKTQLSGTIDVSDATAPERLRLSAKGADATAGGGQGTVEVTLAEDGGETLVSYRGEAEAQGKIGQLGQRLLTGVARQTAETFFARLAERAAAGELPSQGAEALAGSAPVEPAREASLPEAPPLIHEEPAEEPAPVLDAPPLAAGAPGVATLQEPKPIAPTGVPDAPDPAALAAAQSANPETASGFVGRIMMVALIVVVVGVAVYWALLQPPV